MKEVLIGMTILIFVIASVSFGLTRWHDQKSSARAYYAECEYLGSRIEEGYGVTKIWRYNCNGVIEETTLRPKHK